MINYFVAIFSCQQRGPVSGSARSRAMIGSIPDKDVRHLRPGWRTSPDDIKNNPSDVASDGLQ